MEPFQILIDTLFLSFVFALGVAIFSITLPKDRQNLAIILPVILWVLSYSITMYCCIHQVAGAPPLLQDTVTFK